MQLTMLKSKIHRATVTDANLNYAGSITIDPQLMAAARMLEYEQVHVVNINNGSRLVTYTIAGEPGSGTICLNGAAARLAAPGDLVIIIAYCNLDEQEAASYQPKVVQVDANNKIISAA